MKDIQPEYLLKRKNKKVKNKDMNLNIFFESLSSEEYAALEEKVLQIKAKRENSGLKIVDFIEANFDMSPRLIKLLKQEAEEVIYVNKLFKAKLKKYKQIGGLTLSELEFYFNKHHIDTYYYNYGIVEKKYNRYY